MVKENINVCAYVQKSCSVVLGHTHCLFGQGHVTQVTVFVPVVVERLALEEGVR